MQHPILKEHDQLRGLIETRGEKLTKSKDIIDKAEKEKRGLTSAEEQTLDNLAAEIQDLAGKIRPIQERNNTFVRNFDQIMGTGNGLDTAQNWKDQDGNEIRVYNHNEKISGTHLNADPALRGVTLGGFLRTMITGKGTEAEKQALAEGSDSAGGATVPAILVQEWIDRLRDKITIVRAGARTIVLQSAQHNMAKLLTDATATWRDENAAVSVADATFGKVTFTPQSLAVIVKSSRELVQDSLNIEEILERSFAQAFAAEIDRVALLGSGTSPELEGIFNYANINEVDMGTNGAAITSYAPIISAVQKLKESNAGEAGALIMAPRTWGTLTGLTDQNDQPLQRPGAIADIPYFDTNSIPIDQSHGTATDASTIITGDFSDLVLGMRSELRVELLSETYAANYQFGFLAHLRADVKPLHDESFTKITGIIP